EKLLGLAAPLLTPEGICLFPKGKGWQDELTLATPLWHMNTERLSAPGWGESCILKVSQIRHAGAA
ncbi:MAG: 16S rRNA (guanine(527)-N(7))-methyltransferase RsmG, partial [Rhodospirillales bacterium]|nr:16S rRNA (guanine(527)-N(7))-methyltransferase RsmG [Rhodospirillales bacterium]